jgi:hypothetical protein
MLLMRAMTWDNYAADARYDAQIFGACVTSCAVTDTAATRRHGREQHQATLCGDLGI